MIGSNIRLGGMVSVLYVLHHIRGSGISMDMMDMTNIHGWDASWWARYARLVDILNILKYLFH